MDNVTRRYTHEFGLGMAAYIVLVIVSVYGVDHLAASPWRIALAVTPVLPVAYLLLAFLRYLTGIDELQQRIQLLAIGFAAGAVALLTFAYGFLENVGFPHVSPIFIFPMMTALWGLGQAYFSKKYS